MEAGEPRRAAQRAAGGAARGATGAAASEVLGGDARTPLAHLAGADNGPKHRDAPDARETQRDLSIIRTS